MALFQFVCLAVLGTALADLCYYTDGSERECVSCCEHGCCDDASVSWWIIVLPIVVVVKIILIALCCVRRRRRMVIVQNTVPASGIQVNVNPNHAGYNQPQVPTAAPPPPYGKV